MAPVSPLHETGDDERYLKQLSRMILKIRFIKKLLHLSKVWTYILRMLGSVMLSPDATCQFEHRPLQEQLRVCTEHDSYRCIFQLLLQLKPQLYLQAMQQWLVLSIQGGKENKHHATGKQYSCYTVLQNKHDGTVWVLILTAPLLTGMLWCYCTANAMTTFDRQSTPGIIEVLSGVPLQKFNKFIVSSIILFCI